MKEREKKKPKTPGVTSAALISPIVINSAALQLQTGGRKVRRRNIKMRFMATDVAVLIFHHDGVSKGSGLFSSAIISFPH